MGRIYDGMPTRSRRAARRAPKRVVPISDPPCYSRFTFHLPRHEAGALESPLLNSTNSARRCGVPRRGLSETAPVRFGSVYMTAATGAVAAGDPAGRPLNGAVLGLDAHDPNPGKTVIGATGRI